MVLVCSWTVSLHLECWSMSLISIYYRDFQWCFQWCDWLESLDTVKPIFVLHLKLINRMWAEIVGYTICLAACGMRFSPSPELGKRLGVYCFTWKQQQSELLECYDLSQAYHKPSEVIVIGHRKGNITSVCREVYSAARRQAPLYPLLRKKNDVLWGCFVPVQRCHVIWKNGL